MGVLLVNPPTLAGIAARGLLGQVSYFDHECSFTTQHWFKSYPGEHMGLMTLLAVLRAAEIPARSVNGQVERHKTLDETWEAMVAAGQGLDVDVVGFSGPCQVFEENLELARRAKARWPEALTIIGHHFATLNFRRILQDYPEFDAVAMGDGEYSIVALGRGHSESDLAEISGIAWRGADSRIHVQAPPVEPLDLDAQPRMARDELPAIMEIGVSPTVYTTRGCPYRCSYCTTGQTAGMLHKRFGYRERSVEPVIDEIEYLVRDFDIPHLTITDDLFVTKTPESMARAIEFAHAYRDRGLRVPFMLDCRLDSADPEVFAELAAAGCYRVFVGIETGSEEQLAFYNKHYGTTYDVEYVRRRVGGLQDLGIEVIPGILTYHPSSNEQELRETLRVIDACGYVSSWQFLCEVFAHPGTTLWHQFRKQGLLTEEWPVPAWNFVDPHAAEVKDSVLAAVSAGGGNDEARAAFELALDRWRDADLTSSRVPAGSATS